MSERYGKAFDKLRNIEDLKAILSPADLPIHYPRSSKDKDTEGRNYEWFQNNEKYAKEPLELAPEDTKGFPIKFERRR